MQEQTKIALLLLIVIVVAILSMIFVFYQYGKIQTQFTARVSGTTQFDDSIPLQPLTQQSTPQEPCTKPKCQYTSSYRIGPTIFSTGNNDANGKNIQGCHSENTELSLRVETKDTCFVQRLTCTAGGWTPSSPHLRCE